MPLRLSEAFNINPDSLQDEGALDYFVDMDSKLHIDPYLLKDVNTMELKGSYRLFKKHFSEIIRLLDLAKKRSLNDRLFREATKKLMSKEPSFLHLGYSKRSSIGSGIGRGTALNLAKTAFAIVEGGVKDPVIFELVGLFEKGIGADLISDMTGRIILPDLIQFSERVTDKLDIITKQYRYKEKTINLPTVPLNNEPMVLVPTEILRDLPVAHDWDDIDRVVIYNKKLRKKTNKIIGNNWKKFLKLKKEERKRLLINYPDLLRSLIRSYKGKSAKPYDLEDDPKGLRSWYPTAQDYTKSFPLSLELKRATPNEVYKIVKRICMHFKELIENNGLNKLLYLDPTQKKEYIKRRGEEYAQKLYFAIADSYCEANDLDLSPEPNSGRGPVDFKISRGYNAKINVEVKFSDNTHLRHGYEKQLPAYNEAEGTWYSIYLILRNTQSTKQIEEVEKIREKVLQKKKRAPLIIVIDARLRPSASKI